MKVKQSFTQGTKIPQELHFSLILLFRSVVAANDCLQWLKKSDVAVGKVEILYNNTTSFPPPAAWINNRHSRKGRESWEHTLWVRVVPMVISSQACGARGGDEPVNHTQAGVILDYDRFTFPRFPQAPIYRLTRRKDEQLCGLFAGCRDWTHARGFAVRDSYRCTTEARRDC